LEKKLWDRSIYTKKKKENRTNYFVSLDSQIGCFCGTLSLLNGGIEREDFKVLAKVVKIWSCIAAALKCSDTDTNERHQVGSSVLVLTGSSRICEHRFPFNNVVNWKWLITKFPIWEIDWNPSLLISDLAFKQNIFCYT
jgi:hypothetical protein